MIVYLNDTHGPTDKTVYLHIDDPHSYFRLQGGHTYELRLVQPPEFGKIVDLNRLRVYDSDGYEVKQQNETVHLYNKFSYQLKTDQIYADIYMDCDPHATDMSFNGMYST